MELLFPELEDRFGEKEWTMQPVLARNVINAVSGKKTLINDSCL